MCADALEWVRQAGVANDDVYALALDLESLLRRAVRGLGEGPYGRAASCLFGADQMTHGLLLKARRRLAAAELDVLPSTFRKTYEDGIIEDVAVEVWRLIHQR